MSKISRLPAAQPRGFNWDSALLQDRLANTAQSSVVCAHRTHDYAGRFHGLLVQLQSRGKRPVVG